MLTLFWVRFWDWQVRQTVRLMLLVLGPVMVRRASYLDELHRAPASSAPDFPQWNDGEC